MSVTYRAVTGQSLYDICLITYGDISKIGKLASDNGISDLNDINLTGITFTYDNSQVVNQILHQQLNSSYGTAQDIEDFSGGYHDIIHQSGIFD